MGGSSRKRRENRSFRDKFFSVGHSFFDLLSGGYISRLRKRLAESAERERTLSGRVMNLNLAHKEEAREWEKRVGRAEARNERLDLALVKAGSEIAGLEGKLAETQGELALVQERYARAQAIIDANPELEGAMTDLEEYFAKIGVKGEKFGKNALNLIRRMKTFVKMAYEKVEEARRGNVLGRAYVKLADKKAVFVLDEKHRIEAMSSAAESLVGKDVTGKEVAYVSSTLSRVLGYVAPTYEEEFSATLGSVGDSRDVRADVKFERYYGQHIGAFVVIGPKPWYRRRTRMDGAYTLVASGVFDNGAELTKMVNAAVAIDYGRTPICMDLRATGEVSDEVARRIGGLTQSKYFRNRLKMVVGNRDVRDKLVKYDVPKEMMVDGLARDGSVGEIVPEGA
jgi:PAS domain-containing protein